MKPTVMMSVLVFTTISIATFSVDGRAQLPGDAPTTQTETPFINASKPKFEARLNKEPAPGFKGSTGVVLVSIGKGRPPIPLIEIPPAGGYNALVRAQIICNRAQKAVNNKEQWYRGIAPFRMNGEWVLTSPYLTDNSGDNFLLTLDSILMAALKKNHQLPQEKIREMLADSIARILDTLSDSDQPAADAAMNDRSLLEVKRIASPIEWKHLLRDMAVESNNDLMAGNFLYNEHLKNKSAESLNEAWLNYHQAVLANPHSAHAIAQEIAILKRQNRMSQAAALENYLKRIQPGLDEFSKGLDSADSEHWEVAIQHYKKAISKTDGLAPVTVYLFLADAYRTNGNKIEERKVLQSIPQTVLHDAHPEFQHFIADRLKALSTP